MSHALDEKALTARFNPSWKAFGYADVTMLYDNSIVTKPAPERFIRFAVRPSGEEDSALGDGRVRSENYGRIWIQVGFPKAFSAKANELADKATAIFRRWRSGDGQLRCLEVERSTASDDSHHIVTVKISYNSVHYTTVA